MFVALVDQQQTLGKYKVNFTGREDLSGYQLLLKFLTFDEVYELLRSTAKSFHDRNTHRFGTIQCRKTTIASIGFPQHTDYAETILLIGIRVNCQGTVVDS